MKRVFSVIAALALAMTAAAADLIPAPREYKKRDGVFTILTTTKITHYPELRPLAMYLAEYLPLPVHEYNGDRSGNIVLKTDKNMEPEAYSLEVGAGGIEIAGGTAAGVLNGIETLMQLLPAKVYSRGMELPVMVGACRVDDAPRFAYRGFMLDVCRTWVEVDELKRFIDNLAHHKINKLHLHLSDDEAWRIEIKSHPELAEVGGFRGGDSPVAPRYGRWDERYGGFYTQEQMRGLVEYAAVRNIEIIPEIDLPGHSLDLASVHPEVLCGYTPSLKASDGYDTRNVLCVARESNYGLLDDVIGELAGVFDSPFIHIGGDEVDASQWMSCPDCKALMAAHGMKSGAELQAWFMNRVARTVERHGKVPCVWNEAINSGTLTRKARVYGWESVAACRKAAAEGYSTVVLPGAYFYFDMRQSQREAGHDWAGIFDVRKCLSFDFAGQGFTEAEMRNVAGLQANFWSEVYLSHRDADYDFLYYQTYPRMCALSELAWRGRSDGWEEFYARLAGSHYSRMAAMGIGFRLFPPEVKYAAGVLAASVDDRSRIYYKVAGEEGEHPYDGPIVTDRPQRYSFRSVYGCAYSPEAGVAGRFRMLQPKVAVTSSVPQSERFPYSNAESYGRIARTSRTSRAGDWIMYTFEKPVTCRRLEVRTGNLQLPRYIFNSGYMEVSEDGQHFRRVCELKNGGGAVDNPSRPIKAVRVVCTTDGNGAAFVTVQAPMVFPKL